jgi:hypothetical protein
MPLPTAGSPPDGAPSPLVDATGAIAAPWRVVGLPQQKLPVTVYRGETVDGQAAVRIEARASYGNLVHDLPRVPAPARLRWLWRVDRPNPDAELRRKATDDSAAKVCLSFDLPLERVPFIERQLMRLARARSGEPLPAATVCWVWGAREPEATLLHNAYTARVRFVVLRGPDAPIDRWVEEQRDVAADFRRAFGDEWPVSEPLPPVTALIVAGDADNTGATSVAHVAGLRFGP